MNPTYVNTHIGLAIVWRGTCLSGLVSSIWTLLTTCTKTWLLNALLHILCCWGAILTGCPVIGGLFTRRTDGRVIHTWQRQLLAHCERGGPWQLMASEPTRIVQFPSPCKRVSVGSQKLKRNSTTCHSCRPRCDISVSHEHCVHSALKPVRCDVVYQELSWGRIQWESIWAYEQASANFSQRCLPSGGNANANLMGAQWI